MKNGKRASMRPSTACSLSSITASSSRSAVASSGLPEALSASSQATKRDMWVPFCSAGSATSRLQFATVGESCSPMRTVSG